ncbi:MAG: tetratricopeptide repeat protein [Saprospiraceae bacterium]|nr:tetratricopeptide repeat protein [Saprospiraceae bacterium]
MKEAKSKPVLNPVLLKARILYDGGYYAAAFQTLSKNENILSKNSALALEFKYRMGRVHQAQKSYPEAISYLKSTLQQGELNHTYFAASAALQLGLIYEADNQQKAALYYFNRCLQINPPDYKTSLHQKAKSGVERVSINK